MHGDSKVAGTQARTHSFLLLATSVSLHFEVLFFYCKPVLSTQWKTQCRECHSLPALPPNSRKEMKEDTKGKSRRGRFSRSQILVSQGMALIGPAWVR